ncbi:hypothetical protein P154DRAFT_526065 [Amniculicola lignicola CBS 123094]|uniref:Exosome complex protein n=1 Tax=Amniculicola lignicola CBS 123094 TaxID=1392246 RepID=A0A6A5W4F8_9PLEO|nr:hypothetical protein P154DRAFT_526065 [Amniculicola lignicola CBS 123094]
MEPQTLSADQIEDLEANIDELEDALQPLLEQRLPELTSTLPLLDKAKLQVLTAYSINSLIYASLLTAGVNPKTQPVFAEIARLRSYFAKIKDAESGSTPKARLDTAAAARFIAAGLVGNDRYDLERAERIAKEKAKAHLKARRKHIRFDEEDAEKQTGGKAPKESKKRKVEEGAEAEDEEMNDVESENEELYGSEAHASAGPSPAVKKLRIAGDADQDSPSSNGEDANEDAGFTPYKSKAQRRAESRIENHSKKLAKGLYNASPIVRHASRASDNPGRRRRHQGNQENQEEEELIIPQAHPKAPKTHSEAFKALLEGKVEKLPSNGKGKGKGRGKGK